MKLILHIGMPKTGTSTLQQALSVHRRTLHDAGVLYPQTPGPQTNHNALSCVLLPWERIQREFRNPRRSPASVKAFGDEFWNDIERQVSSSRATTTVLSSEYLFSFRDDEVQALRALLDQLFDAIEVVVYVRHPADFYLSMMQQKVKASDAIRPPSEFRTRIAICIKRYLRAFDGQVSVRSFEREPLIGGSIVQDFVGRSLPSIAGGPSAFDIDEVNTSMSGEAMCIVQSLRRHAWPDADDVFMPECQHVIAVLRDIREQTQQSVPRLKPAIDAGITRRHQAELDWLRSDFGVEFDHAADASFDGPDDPGWTSSELTEILDIDQVAIDRTAALLLKELAARAIAAARTGPEAGSSSRRQIPRRRSGTDRT